MYLPHNGGYDTITEIVLDIIPIIVGIMFATSGDYGKVIFRKGSTRLLGPKVRMQNPDFILFYLLLTKIIIKQVRNH